MLDDKTQAAVCPVCTASVTLGNIATRRRGEKKFITFECEECGATVRVELPQRGEDTAKEG